MRDEEKENDLAVRIRDYWIARGYLGIRTWVVAESAPHSSNVIRLWGVRSNIGRGGYPPRLPDAPAAGAQPRAF